jgi:hypothetical protein
VCACVNDLTGRTISALGVIAPVVASWRLRLPKPLRVQPRKPRLLGGIPARTAWLSASSAGYLASDGGEQRQGRAQAAPYE